MMLRTPDPVMDKHQQDQRLRRAIVRMIARFRAQTGMNFSDEQGLTDQLYIHLEGEGLLLLGLGGLIYSLGVIFYVAKRIPYNHAIWHLFVLGGSVCHFMAIYGYVA